MLLADGVTWRRSQRGLVVRVPGSPPLLVEHHRAHVIPQIVSATSDPKDLVAGLGGTPADQQLVTDLFEANSRRSGVGRKHRPVCTAQTVLAHPLRPRDIGHRNDRTPALPRCRTRRPFPPWAVVSNRRRRRWNCCTRARSPRWTTGQRAPLHRCPAGHRPGSELLGRTRARTCSHARPLRPNTGTSWLRILLGRPLFLRRLHRRGHSAPAGTSSKRPGWTRGRRRDHRNSPDGCASLVDRPDLRGVLARSHPRSGEHG